MAEEGREKDGKFKKGNLFSIGNNGGQPPKFETPRELHDKIAEYLEWENQWKNPSAKGEGKGLYTLSGCALYLGFCSKSSMDDQAKRDSEFSNVISRFKLFLTHWNEQKIYWGGSFNGAKLWLTNFGGYLEEVTQNQQVTVTELKIESVNVDEPLANDE